MNLDSLPFDEIPPLVTKIEISQSGLHHYTIHIEYFDDMVYSLDEVRAEFDLQEHADHPQLWAYAERLYPWLKRCLDAGYTELTPPATERLVLSLPEDTYE